MNPTGTCAWTHKGARRLSEDGRKAGFPNDHHFSTARHPVSTWAERVAPSSSRWGMPGSGRGACRCSRCHQSRPSGSTCGCASVGLAVPAFVHDCVGSGGRAAISRRCFSCRELSSLSFRVASGSPLSVRFRKCSRARRVRAERSRATRHIFSSLWTTRRRPGGRMPSWSTSSGFSTVSFGIRSYSLSTGRATPLQTRACTHRASRSANRRTSTWASADRVCTRSPVPEQTL